ncbi:glycosyltransferase family 61 protein [Paraburkholderia pallida]|uniref:Glycosyltransferase family 61 protein n=1 Tax=Paraburkholderia pallida TaxID=2547399 RepID=A0A4P7CR30_9BURK|nr:glycosyltransferase family 61 protein [Paraburkholderia pallida]QBQ98338.1 glycosyltransferase family 61 protein [Paraburkholderia pallida]
MDSSYLLSNFRPVGKGDEQRKMSALEYAYQVSGLNYPFDQFLRNSSEFVKSHVFGGEADDYYFTSMLATFEQHESDLDAFFAVVLNKIVLQLEFQTRHFTSGYGPELFVCDAPKSHFRVAIANASTTAGLLCSDPAQRVLPEWADNLPHIEYNFDNVHCRNIQELSHFAESIRRKVGAVALSLPVDIDHLKISERFAALAGWVDENTTYVFCGKKSVLLAVKRKLEERYPHATVQCREYTLNSSAAREEKAIVLVDGLSGLPDIDIEGFDILDCRFTTAAASSNPDFRNLSFAETEFFKPVEPKKIISFAPISTENSLKMTSEIQFYNDVVTIKNGSITSQRGTVDSTYLHFAESGEIAMDAGNEIARTEMTELYRSGVNVDGIVTARLRQARVLDVTGPAMPLAFTPDVHTFFSHFILQCFPRILILRELGIPNAKIVVPHNLRAKQLAMLRLAGITEEQIVKMPPGVIVKADELIVPRAWPLAMSSFTIRIYEELLGRVVKTKRRPRKNLLISRESRRTWRNMVNYDSVRKILVDRYHFEEVRPEKLTIEEEIDLFNQSKVLIGAEGAGMYASCFAQENSHVISICDEDYMMPILGTIGRLRGFNLYHVFGESFRSARDVNRRLPYGHCDFTVNPLDVAELVEQLI